MMPLTTKCLLEALEQAIAEIRKHNCDYHHITRPETIKPWEQLIEEVKSL